MASESYDVRAIKVYLSLWQFIMSTVLKRLCRSNWGTFSGFGQGRTRRQSSLAAVGAFVGLKYRRNLQNIRLDKLLDRTHCSCVAYDRPENLKSVNFKANGITNQTVAISIRARIWLWVAAWLIAAFAASIPDPRVLLFAFLFPTGLAEFVPKGFWLLEPPDTGYLWFAIFCVLYVGLTVIALLQSRRLWYFVLYAALCIILALNVVGCHIQNNRGIHT